jgi:hypothetical protein
MERNKEKNMRKKKENIRKKKKSSSKNNNENIIRNISNIILDSTEKIGLNQQIIGTIYTYIHHLLVFLVAFIFSFNNNIIHLCVLLIIVSLDAFSVVVLHGCPLTQLEQKYLNENTCEIRSNQLKNARILYKCDHEYEKQIELLINIWMLISGKCLLLIFFNTFNFKLHNYNNTYA